VRLSAQKPQTGKEATACGSVEGNPQAEDFFSVWRGFCGSMKSAHLTDTAAKPGFYFGRTE
jgi:hypothetical protein